MTCHVVMPDGHPGDDFLMDSAQDMRRTYRIGQTTLQIETRQDNGCALAPDNVA